MGAEATRERQRDAQGIEQGLGVHVTIDLAGHMRFGPDAYYIDRPADPWATPDYTVYDTHLDDAHKAITRYHVEHIVLRLPRSTSQPV